ncbi:MAG: response regulator [Rhodocyclaceae bacterium]|nr:response regulator [Rhodocyclaceae bacterium]
MKHIEQPRDADQATRRLVDAERIALLYRLTPMTLGTAVVFSLIVAWTLHGSVSGRVILAWFLVNNAVSLVRYLDILAYRRAAPPPERARHWLRRFVPLTLCAGTIWGLMGTVLLPSDDIAIQAIMTVFLTGTAAVGLFTLSSSLLAYAALAGPVLVPPAVYMIAMGRVETLGLGAALLFFVLLVFLNARRAVRNTVEMLTLRFDNARIAAEREMALHAAEAAGRARLQFLANMSHEIRTPLNGILGMAQLLETGELDTGQRHRVDAIRASGQHLLVLINDILDFSKLDAGKLEVFPEPFEVRRLPREVTDLMSARAQEKGLRLSMAVAPEVPQWLSGDASRIKQVLNNLISNAVKFTDAGGVEVDVGLSGGEGMAGRTLVRFAVRDSGVGIAEASQARLFEMFSQVDGSPTRRHGGTGLGLAISRQLVELMGGRIGCDSRPGEGATFWFELPLAAASAPAAAPAAGESGGATSLAGRVLLVEDNAVNSEIALAMLGRMGVAADRAEDGLAALRAVEQTDFDLILMDCQMPNMDGFEATRRMIARERSLGLAHTPIVALTANAIRGDREACIAAGMDDYLAKPFLFDALRAALERWLPPR